MAQNTEKVVPVDIEDEMRGSYIDYSMSVIVSRALPDVRDGLKPVHRRVLYGMRELGLASNKPYKKSARIVGEVLGKYHPHGDSAVYDAMVRMAQDFSMRYPLVDGQGNFGSVDGDSPAAMRYTEARLSPIAEEILRDLEKNTVKFAPNFDDTLEEPTVMPSLFPSLLCNGTSGIAVGMATNMPPHNLGEVVDACVSYIHDPKIANEKLMKHIIAPDFPTGGIIYGYEGVKEAYTTGKGKVVIRAKATIETGKGDRQRIVVTELPYTVNKAAMIEKIADLVNDKKLEDIADVRDESDRDGLRVVIDLKRDAIAQVVLNNLFKHTQMQLTFGVNMLSLVEGKPEVLQLKDLIRHFIEHRNTVVVRRTKFDLDEAEKRAHILEGYIIALDNIDAVIKLIRASKDVEEARNGLMKKFKLSELQAKAILDMRLQKLTGLERKKVEQEYRETIKLIERLRSILKNKNLQLKIIEDELMELKETFGDPRRTEIVYKAEEFSIEDMIAEEDVVITVTHGGYIKRTPVSGYRRQSRGGKGITGASTDESDFIEHMFIASTHHQVLFFTNRGRCYSLKVHEIPEASRTSRGKSINNLISRLPDEMLTAFIAVKEFTSNHYVMMATKNGTVKKVALDEFENTRKNGILATTLHKNDVLVDVRLTDGNQDIVIGTTKGMAIRFHEDQIRSMGRTAAGVRGIRLGTMDSVVGMIALRGKGTSILVATALGFGKRSDEEEYRVTSRGGKGVYTVRTSEKTGNMVAIKAVLNSDDIVVVTEKGMIIRQRAEDIRLAGRNTQGVRLIRLESGDRVAAVAAVASEEETERQMEGSSSVPKESNGGQSLEVSGTPAQSSLFNASLKKTGRRGRPPKTAETPKSSPAMRTKNGSPRQDAEPQRRKRGRPKKK